MFSGGRSQAKARAAAAPPAGPQPPTAEVESAAQHMDELLGQVREIIREPFNEDMAGIVDMMMGEATAPLQQYNERVPEFLSNGWTELADILENAQFNLISLQSEIEGWKEGVPQGDDFNDFNFEDVPEPAPAPAPAPPPMPKAPEPVPVKAPAPAPVKSPAPEPPAQKAPPPAPKPQPVPKAETPKAPPPAPMPQPVPKAETPKAAAKPPMEVPPAPKAAVAPKAAPPPVPREPEFKPKADGTAGFLDTSLPNTPREMKEIEEQEKRQRA